MPVEGLKRVYETPVTRERQEVERDKSGRRQKRGVKRQKEMRRKDETRGRIDIRA